MPKEQSPGKPTTRRYSPEEKVAAVRMDGAHLRAELGTGAVPSIGTVGDSFDNALAETVNGYYKSELIYGPARTGPWKTIEDVELATLGWVHWHNTSRLHGYLNDTPSRIRSHLLRYKTDRPTPGRNPIAQASIRTRAIQLSSSSSDRNGFGINEVLVLLHARQWRAAAKLRRRR
jgi:putative transposase